ncbi:hypothetical protein GF337_04980 [candidate division KSB1 bacterium]|nr:hypothetical protein [candidate division KSB1 bacterium]
MVFKEIFLKKSVIITLSLILFFLIIEFTLDPVEIILGEILEATNPIRPKSGTIWELSEQNLGAAEDLSQISPKPESEQQAPEVDTVYELKVALDERDVVLLSSEQFLKIYNMLSPAAAGQIISPFDLLRFSHDQSWVWTKISKSDDRLSIFFLKGDNEILTDSYPDISVLYERPFGSETRIKSLESLPEFRGRTFTAQQFFRAFNQLPRPTKLQLINNPYRLLQWHQHISKVGISNGIQDYTIQIAFEVADQLDTKIYTFQASTIAANHFINQLNSLYPELNLKMPEF